MEMLNVYHRDIPQSPYLLNMPFFFPSKLLYRMEAQEHPCSNLQALHPDS